MQSRPARRTLLKPPAYLAVRETLSTTTSSTSSSSSSSSLLAPSARGTSGMLDSPRPLHNHCCSQHLQGAKQSAPHLLTRVVAKWLDRHCPSGTRLLCQCLQASAGCSSPELRSSSAAESFEQKRLTVVVETMAGMEVVPPIHVHAMATVATVRSCLRMRLSDEQRRSGRVCLFRSNGQEIVDQKIRVAEAVGLSTKSFRDSGKSARIVLRLGFQVPKVNYLEVSQRVAIALRSSIQRGQPLVAMRMYKLTPQDRVYWTIPSDDDALLVFLNNERIRGYGPPWPISEETSILGYARVVRSPHLPLFERWDYSGETSDTDYMSPTDLVLPSDAVFRSRLQ